MRIYRIATGAHLEQLGDPIGEVPILNIPLAKYMADICKEAGLELVEVSSEEEIRNAAPHVIFDDDLFFTRGYLTFFLDEARKRGRNAVAANPPTGQWKALGELQDNVTITETEVRYNHLRYVVPEDNGEPEPVVVDTESGYLWKQNWLEHVTPGFTKTYHPVTNRYILQLIIPMHLGIANLFARFDRLSWGYREGVGKFLIDLLQKGAKWLGKEDEFLRFMEDRWRQRADKGFPRIAYPLFRLTSKIGKNCQIHPTAVIEGSDIGDNVRIGAYSVVQWSTIGDNVEINEFSHMRLCSVGEGTLIPQISRISASLVYPKVFWAARSVNFGVVGREAQLYFSLYSDFRLDGSAQTTLFHGKVVDAKVPFLGVTIGHRAKVAGGLITAPGRFVPNGVTVLPPNDTVFVKAPKGTKEGDIIRLGKKT